MAATRSQAELAALRAVTRERFRDSGYTPEQRGSGAAKAKAKRAVPDDVHEVLQREFFDVCEEELSALLGERMDYTLR